MAAFMEQVASSREEQEPLFTTTTVNLEVKSCGDWGVAMGTGGGYRWECLATSQHVGGLGVMVVHCRLGATTIDNIRILPRRQSSPIQGQRCFLHMERGL